jgi:hypothetical protein
VVQTRNSAIDSQFLTEVAFKVLGTSSVATSTSERLAALGVDSNRVAEILMARGKETNVGAFKFKLIDADPETPKNFGLLVRINPGGQL